MTQSVQRFFLVFILKMVHIRKYTQYIEVMDSRVEKGYFEEIAYTVANNHSKRCDLILHIGIYTAVDSPQWLSP